MMLFTIVSGAVVTYAIAYFDVIVHYDYVLPIQSECYQSNPNSPNGNPSKFCVDEWSRLGIPLGDQKNIPSPYWVMLNGFVYVMAGVVAGMRLTFSITLAMIIKKPFTWITGYSAFVTGATISTFLLTSWGDAIYFKILKMQIPSTLPWLNSSGVFPSLLKLTHHADVTTNDLYLAMGIGIIIVVSLWIPIIIAYARAGKNVKELI